MDPKLVPNLEGQILVFKLTNDLLWLDDQQSENTRLAALLYWVPEVAVEVYLGLGSYLVPAALSGPVPNIQMLQH